MEHVAGKDKRQARDILFYNFIDMDVQYIDVEFTQTEENRTVHRGS